jgi:hypothetical protein
MSRVRVYVTEDAVRRVREVATSAAPFETGGVLIGVATPDGVWISDFAVIPGRARHRARFVIPAGATHEAVDRAREADPRLGYLGDWHTHPSNAGPSGVDFTTLRDLASGPFGGRRLLGLLRRSGIEWDLGLWVLDRLRVPNRVTPVLSGPVPPTD